MAERSEGLLTLLLAVPLSDEDALHCARAHGAREQRKKGDENRMINFDHMTAMDQVTRSRPAMFVRKGAPWNGFAFLGIEQQCGRSSAPGGAD